MSNAKIFYSNVVADEIISPNIPRIAFYADSDDHLRVPALLTLQLRQHYHELSQAGAACLDPDASWNQRLESLQEILEDSGKLWRRSNERGPVLLLENIEALINSRLDSPSKQNTIFINERKRLSQTLFSALGSCGIWAQTGTTVPEELEELQIENCNHHERRLEHLLIDVPLVLRDLIQRRIELGEDDWVGIELVVEAGADDLIEHLLWEMYTTLPARARVAVRQLAALRGTQSYNGILGDLIIHDKTIPSEAKVSRSAVEQLINRGWLVKTSPNKLVMPWLLRVYALKQANMWTPDEQQDTWSALVTSSKAIDNPTPIQTMELHHRAVEAIDIEEAWASATYYTGDMLAIARRLSDARQYIDAAKIYREIVRRNDDDAYAWEYLAFNLALADKQAHEDEITQGYKKAHELARQRNPNSLYWARWLVWRMERQIINMEKAGEEFDEALRALEPLPQYDRFSRFAQPIHTYLKRMGHVDLYNEWVRGWEQRINLGQSE